jgi:hypothetical protein
MLLAVMTAPRENWTDERLDDLNKKVDDGFARLAADLRGLRGDVKDLRREMNGRFESLNRTLILATIGGNAAIIAALIGVNVF